MMTITLEFFNCFEQRKAQRTRQCIHRRMIKRNQPDGTLPFYPDWHGHPARSRSIAIPCPTPMHMAHSANRDFRTSSSRAAVAAIRAPLMPSG
jgi:hypothetical protein